jgi:hypothetical protein
MVAYRLANPVTVGDHKDAPNEWSDTTPVRMYWLDRKVNATIQAKHDEKNLYIRVNSLNDTKISAQDRCDIWFDQKHNSSVAKPQKDDFRITSFWRLQDGKLSYLAAVSYGTGDGWGTASDRFLDGSLIADCVDSFTSQISGYVVHEFKIPRASLENADRMAFGACLVQGDNDDIVLGECVWPSGFGILHVHVREWSLNQLGILIMSPMSTGSEPPS